MRLVLDQVFKAAYKQGKRERVREKSEKILRTTLQILLSMLVNNIFERANAKERF
jgi:DNA topoisomerase IB